ncbi:ComEC/Rec2 family competence protein [Pseudahrensia aquimaris]|uniref:ComEC/Rec2 family competence protein n=1 Tax=Pseudahrensia aquimaris TaxID=744461 RepID=A0ABW3FGA5_9HYPH
MQGALWLLLAVGAQVCGVVSEWFCVSERRSNRQEEWLPVTEAVDLYADPSVSFDVHEPGEDALLPTALWSDASPALPEQFHLPAAAPQRLKLRLAQVTRTVLDDLSNALTREQAAGVFFLWSPVFFAIGCITYFNVPREPLAFAFPVLALICAFSTYTLRGGPALHSRGRSLLRGGALALCIFALGASAAHWRTASLNTTMLSRAYVIDLKGTVERVERRSDGRVRYTVLPDASAGGRGALPENFNALVRVTARKGGPNIATGERIAGKARLAPPSGPSYPGGYSFAFQSWFDGIGASGFFLGKPQRLGSAEDGGWPSVNGVRESIVSVIRTALPGQSGALASALIVGDRSGIDEETAEALRLSGLAHILAISGLHMALLSATVIALMRVGFACAPSVALTRPVKKWAAATALLAATIYLVLSGGSVATQRAWIMVAIMLVAVMLDQRALTMRNVAIAALIVLLITPEAVLMPGFQMSFAAVAALVASYEVLTKRTREKRKASQWQRHSVLRRFIVRDVGGLAMTSLVAGLATGLFAAYHFHRVAALGLIANLAAMPLVSVIVMPLALISVLAMPFGLESYPLWVMAMGVEGVVGVAKWVAEHGPSGATGRLTVSTLIFATLGLLVLCLLKTRLRLIGVGFFILAGLMAGKSARPDVLILENGRQVAVFGSQGNMALLRPRAEKFSVGIWQRAYPFSGGNEVAERFACDLGGCSFETQGLVIAHISARHGLGDDCHMADILIVPFAADGLCSDMAEIERPLIIDQKNLRRHGAHALHIGGSANSASKGSTRAIKLRVEKSFSAAPRLWTRHRFAVD